MKGDRGGFRMLRHEQLLQEKVHDAYKAKRKPRGVSRCPDCGAVYRRGRWVWALAPGHAAPLRCPACHRIREHLPAGYVSLSGSFFAAHREEILARVRQCEADEKAEHPLQRIIKIEEDERGSTVTTTDPHLARRVGEALRAAFKGEITYRYGRDQQLLRVRWSR